MFHMPMSSPMIMTMFGCCGCCADAGVLATVTTVTSASNPSQIVLAIPIVRS